MSPTIQHDLAVAAQGFAVLYGVLTIVGNFLALRQNPKLSAFGQALVKWALELSTVQKTLTARRATARIARINAAKTAGLKFDDTTPTDPPGAA